MNIYIFELTRNTTLGIKSDSIFTITEYLAIEKENYYYIPKNDFKIYKDELNQLQPNGCMVCLSSDPTNFIHKCIQQTKENIEFHENYIKTLTQKLSILQEG